MCKKKLCIFNNTAPLYREGIFMKMEEVFDCDWYFRPTLTDIKEMDVRKLKRVKYLKICGDPFKVYWKFGFLKLLTKKEYQTFIMTLEVHCLTDWLFVLFKTLFYKKKKIYAWTHGYYGRETKIELILKRWLFKHITGAFTYGKYAKDIMIREGIPEGNLFVIHNSLQYDQQIALREVLNSTDIFKNHFGNDNKVLIFIGRLTKVKQLHLLINALKILKDQNKYYNLILVGTGSEKEMLSEKVRTLSLNNQVWFYGPCYDEKINAELIYNSDLCVSPGNVGLTAIHSLVFGTPVLTHNNFKYQMPEFEAIRDGVTGAFFEQNDENSLSEAIDKWFLNYSKQREVIRQACFAEIDNFWNPNYQIDVLKKNILFN